MARLNGRLIWLSLLVMVLFSPVVLASGSAAFRPGLYLARVGGVPLSVWLVVVLIAVFVGLVALFAHMAAGAAAADDGSDRP